MTHDPMQTFFSSNSLIFDFKLNFVNLEQIMFCGYLLNDCENIRDNS
jgi:hypothetical protein